MLNCSTRSIEDGEIPNIPKETYTSVTARPLTPRGSPGRTPPCTPTLRPTAPSRYAVPANSNTSLPALDIETLSPLPPSSVETSVATQNESSTSLPSSELLVSTDAPSSTPQETMNTAAEGCTQSLADIANATFDFLVATSAQSVSTGRAGVRTKASRRTAQKRRREPSTPATDASRGRARCREASPAVPTPTILPRRLPESHTGRGNENEAPARPMAESTPYYLDMEGFVSSASLARPNRGAMTRAGLDDEGMDIDELLPSSPTPEPTRPPLHQIPILQSTLAARTGCSQYAYTLNQPTPPRPTALRLECPAARTRMPRERGAYLHAVSPTQDIFLGEPRPPTPRLPILCPPTPRPPLAGLSRQMLNTPQATPPTGDAMQPPQPVATPAIRHQPVQIVNIRTPARGRPTYEQTVQDMGNFTPTPAGGFPEIHHATPDALTRGMDPNCIRNPETAVDDPVLYVQVYNVGYPTSLQQARDITRDITAAITAFSGETGFVIVPPVPPQGALLNPRDLPRTWPILGLSGTTVDHAADQHILSYRNITIMAYRPTQTIPRWTIRLISFTHNVGNQIQTMVREAFERGPIRRRIEEMAAENLDFAPAMEPSLWADALLHTLQIDVFVMSSGAIFANVLMDSPTADPEVWCTWIEELHTIEFRSPYNAPARAQRTTWCDGCHSVAHPTHLCPFPYVPGWNGPQAGTGAYSVNPAPGQPGAESSNTAEPLMRNAGSTTRGGYNGPYAARGRMGWGRGHGRGFCRGAVTNTPSGAYPSI